MSRTELGTMCYSNGFCRLLCVKNSKTSPGCNESLPQIYQRYITKDIDDMDEASSKVAAESVEKALKDEMKAVDDGGVTIRGYFGWPIPKPIRMLNHVNMPSYFGYHNR